jgi:hypothetical protein
MDELSFAQIGSALSDIAANAAPGPAASGPSGSFSYAPEQLRDLVKEWMDLANDYSLSIMNARDLTTVKGPGKEYASESYANEANRSGVMYRDSLQQRSDYCVQEAQKLQDALDDYLGVEHHNLSVIKAAGPQEGV